MYFYLLQNGTIQEHPLFQKLSPHNRELRIFLIGVICYFVTHLLLFSGIFGLSFLKIQPYYWALLVFDLFLTTGTYFSNKENDSTKNIIKSILVDSKENTNTNQTHNNTNHLPETNNNKLEKKKVHFEEDKIFESETNIESELDFDLTDFEKTIKV